MTMTEQRLHRIWEQSGAEALFLECDFLRRYLTGFDSTDGFVVLGEEGCTFVADLRYLEAAEKFLAGSGIAVREGRFREAVSLLGTKKRVGVPFPFLSVASLRRLEEEGLTCIDCMPALRAAMIVKSADEIAHIQMACDVAEEAFLALLPQIREGMTERETAALLEYEMRRKGAEGTSFDTICAFGANGSVPHHATGESRLRFGDAVLIDFGCKIKGYCSDITRTFLFGEDGKHGEFKRAYAAVLEAHERAKERIVSGMTGKEADEIARAVLRDKGLDKLFTHSLGHGIGLQIHEAPGLSPRSEDVLTDGMVFSDEPGVYLAGQYGIRIEDSVVLEGGRVRSFMKKTQRELMIL